MASAAVAYAPILKSKVSVERTPINTLSTAVWSVPVQTQEQGPTKV